MMLGFAWQRFKCSHKVLWLNAADQFFADESRGGVFDSLAMRKGFYF